MIPLLRLEVALFAKDRALQGALLVLAIVLIATVFTGRISEERQRIAFLEAAERIHFEWQNQPPRNPHEAAHYGLFVYRGEAPLAAIDSGVLSHQGAALFLEAHRRNEPYLSPASMRQAPTGLTADKLLPLFHVAGGLTALVIGLLIGSRDQRRRTAPLLASVDGERGRFKARAIFVLALIVAVSSAAFFLSFLGAGSGEAALRLLLTMGVSVLHLGALATLGVIGGATIGARPGGVAVIALLWGLGAIAAPRLFGLAAEALIPTTQIAFETQLTEDLKQVLNAHGQSDENEAFKERVLQEYGVDSVEDLPLNYDALIMQEDEYQRAPIFEARIEETAKRARTQDAIRAISWLFSPTPAMLETSARLSGAHMDAQRAFDRAAEAYRLQVVEKLNMHMAQNSETGNWAWTADDEFYRTFSAFEPPTPDLAADAKVALMPVAAVILWLLAALMGLTFITRKQS